MKTGLLGASAALVIFVGSAVQAGYEQPVRPGGVNGQEFWNAKAVQFVFAPAFGFSRVAGAAVSRECGNSVSEMMGFRVHFISTAVKRP